MPTRDLTFAIVGSGGDGVITVGDMIAQAGAAEGLHVMQVESYGPQIRGGESSCTVRLSADPIFAQGDLVEVLVVFNWADFSRFRGEIICGENAIVLYEATDETPHDQIDLGPIEEERLDLYGPRLARRPLPLVGTLCIGTALDANDRRSVARANPRLRACLVHAQEEHARVIRRLPRITRACSSWA